MRRGNNKQMLHTEISLGGDVGVYTVNLRVLGMMCQRNCGKLKLLIYDHAHNNLL
jgi:hypothetical protein